ncbi:dihydropyrimidinase [Synergistales bacterium]|nr:dihydropyrimidinase [Synergistales bacterium]
MALVLEGGKVVGTDIVREASIRIENGVITRVGLDITLSGDETRDISGMYALPGGIDAHTHFDLPLSPTFRAADNFTTGTKAAIAGGTTCVIDYATQFKGETLARGLDNWHALADGKCFCDYAFHLAITDWNEAVTRELPGVVERGVTSFKMYMAYKGSLQMDDSVLYSALKKLKVLDALLCVHCENGDIIAARTEEMIEAGHTTPEYHPLSRPEGLETEAANRLLLAASLTDAPVYIVHVSAGATMRKIIDAKLSGQRVYAETCPQYLYLDDGLYLEPDAAKYVCSPPLRNKKNNALLWSALSQKLIDVVATDHCSFNLTKKNELSAGGFNKIPNGMPGVESRMLLLYKGVKDGRITLPQMAALSSARPAQIFGMYPRKGILAPGSDADIVLIDPRRKTVISAARQFQNVDYTPFEGMELPASIDSVYLRGEKVFQNGAFLTETPIGEYIPRKAKSCIS